MSTPAKPADRFVMPMTRRESARQLTSLINCLTAAADQVHQLLPDYMARADAETAFRGAADAALDGLTYTLERPA